MTTAAKGSKSSVDKKKPVDERSAAHDSTSGAEPATGATAAGPTAPVEAESHGPRLGDWVIAGISVLFFAGAFLLSLDWPFRAALFPRIITAAGFLLGLVKLLGLALAARRAPAQAGGTAVVPSGRAADVAVQPADTSSAAIDVRTAAVAGQQSAAGTERDDDGPLLDVQIVDDEQEEDESMEYVFASAGGRAWAAALGWVAAFFLSFFVLGAFITVPLFAFVYLKISGKASWWSAAIYAVVTGVLIFVVFRDVVYIPLPESVFPGLNFDF